MPVNLREHAGTLCFAATSTPCGAHLDRPPISSEVHDAGSGETIGVTPRLVAFVNRGSGKLLRNERLYRGVTSLCDGRATLKAVTNDDELIRAVRELPPGPNLEVGILGGDGTHRRVMSALHAVRGQTNLPLLVSIPFGTVNTTNRRWQGQGAPLRAFENWLDREPLILRRQRTLSITLNEDTELIGCTVGTGLVAQFFEAYETAGGGPTTAARIAVQSFFGSFVSSKFSRTIMRPTRCRISVDGRRAEPTEFSLVVCSVFKDVGLGIKVTYRAGNAENKIALVTSSLPASKLGPQFWRVLSGRALRDPQGIDCLAREWAILFDDRGPLIIDGDRFNVKCATIRPGPVWSVLCPN